MIAMGIWPIEELSAEGRGTIEEMTIMGEEDH